MIAFILSPENKTSLSKANRNLLQSVLARPVNSLVPTKAVTDKWRNELRQLLRDSPVDDVARLIDEFYMKFGDKKLSEYVDFDKAAILLPLTKEVATGVLSKFMKAHENKIKVIINN